MSKTIDGSADLANGTIAELTFYKNPVFLSLVLYVVIIFNTYLYMSESTKNSFVFGNKFRNSNGDINWVDMYTYPYDSSKNTVSSIYGVAKNPITWYFIVFSLLCSSFINMKLVNYQVYFHSIMFSYLIFLLLMLIHILLYNYVPGLEPNNVDIELSIGDQRKIKGGIHSYRNFYRTQWLLLFYLSPIYVCVYVYIMRKL